jgi:hypothetical protein
MRVVGKCLRDFLITLGQVVCGNGQICPKLRVFFMCKKCTTFGIERIIALRSVNKIFPESYDFAANVYDDTNSIINIPYFSTVDMIPD